MGSNIKFKAACTKEVGRSHISTNTPCQDHVSVKRNAKKGTGDFEGCASKGG